MTNARSKLATAAAVVAAAAGGAALANAATDDSSSRSSASSSSAGRADHGPHTVNGRSEEALTGDVAAKVRAAALKKQPGTVERVETNVDGSAPYEAHIRKADGTSVEVQVNKDYSVEDVNEMGGHGGPGGHHGPDGPREGDGDGR